MDKALIKSLLPEIIMILTILFTIFGFSVKKEEKLPSYVNSSHIEEMYKVKSWQGSRPETIFVIHIDSCEYLYMPREGLIHKQNCKFCKEREKHEQ